MIFKLQENEAWTSVDRLCVAQTYTELQTAEGSVQCWIPTRCFVLAIGLELTPRRKHLMTESKFPAKVSTC